MKSIEKKRMLFKILVLLLLLAFLGVNSYAVDDNSTNSTSSDEISSDIAATDSTNNTPNTEAPETNVTSDSSTSGDSQNSGNADLTDFSNATFKLVKDGKHDVALEITGVTPKSNSSSYYVCLITSIDTAPSEIEIGTGKYMSVGDGKLSCRITEYVELNQDLYVSIYEDRKLSCQGKKLERFAEPNYSDSFFATFMSEKMTQIITNFTKSSDTRRKMQIKVGKVTDTAILQKIKNQNSSGFADLLNFARSSSGIYDQVVQANDARCNWL